MSELELTESPKILKIEGDKSANKVPRTFVVFAISPPLMAFCFRKDWGCRE